MPASGTTLTHLRELYRAMSRSTTGWRNRRYRIPALWQRQAAPGGPGEVDPFAFYTGMISSIIERESVPPAPSGGWSAGAVVYNMMVRLTSAYDHDGDGTLAPLNADGWRENGSFLKAIALLPYIRALGADTIHLLPVKATGTDGRRGLLGSPYAVRDPGEFEPMLGEPQTGINIRSQFAALVEAAHQLGIRVMIELPLRTMSKDCIWAKDHPEWFYWIGADHNFRPPSFHPDDIRLAGEKVARGDFDSLPEPDASYKRMFSDPPDPSTVRMEGGRWAGTSPDGRKVVIPGAFADWPPDDHQPVWEDITYLKFHQDKRYNYPAYNTVRMYDSCLTGGDTKTTGLWSVLATFVSQYASEFGVDGVMVDMAHALPEELTGEIVGRAREVNPGFVFWAEDFTRTAGQVKEGYNAVLGGQWACQHNPGDFRDMLSWISRTPELLPHLAAPETHNTPRAVTRKGGEAYSRYAWTVSCFIPAIPFIHSGFELFERRPVNTGLGFTPEELASFPASDLPLFSAHALDWESAGSLPGWIREPLLLRHRFRDCILPGSGAEFRLVDAGESRILAFQRSNAHGTRRLLLVANTDMEHSVAFRISGLSALPASVDLLTGAALLWTAGNPEGILQPGQVVLFASADKGG